uniref:Uncharacterized protein n=1 Tax=Arundo donax TaxID=35708 RepID=A0A0A9A662_ARUDO
MYSQLICSRVNIHPLHFSYRSEPKTLHLILVNCNFEVQYSWWLGSVKIN